VEGMILHILQYMDFRNITVYAEYKFPAKKEKCGTSDTDQHDHWVVWKFSPRSIIIPLSIIGNGLAHKACYNQDA
jgi:hypothetical protein